MMNHPILTNERVASQLLLMSEASGADQSISDFFAGVRPMRNRSKDVAKHIGENMSQRSLAEVQTARSADLGGLRASFQNLLVAHSFRYYAVTYFPALDRPGLLQNLVIANWPRELLAMYRNTDMLRDSCIVAHLKSSVLPIRTESLRFASASEARRTDGHLQTFHDYGFAHSVGLSLYDRTGRQYLVVLSGERELSDDDMGRLVFDAMKAIDAVPIPEAANYSLTDREICCLRWSAAGKNSEEIALILSLSPHTVNGYLKAAMSKLETVTRTQAVAKASRLRLI